MRTLQIRTVCGSLRRRSHNAMALDAAAAVAPGHMHFAPVAFEDVPLYNQDVQDAGFPDGVLRVADALRACDGVVIASPEYNYTIAGPLKNLLDWLSRVPDQPLKFKPVAILSASTGPLGGARHQADMRRVLGCLEAFVMFKPEVLIGLCHTKFDADGRVTDAATKKILTEHMTAFDRWLVRLSPALQSTVSRRGT